MTTNQHNNQHDNTVMSTGIIAQSNTHPVEVPLVFNDLKQNLTLEDTLHALTQLQSVFDHTFDRLESRVSQEKARLAHINARTAVCHGVFPRLTVYSICSKEF